jgi:hypothetical protein
MTYAEYLQSQGATAEDIKLLDTPIGRRSFEGMVAAQAEIEKQRTEAAAYRGQVDNWYDDTKSKVAKVETELVASKANEARAIAVLREMNKRGMVDIAKDFGFDPEAAPAAPARVEPNVDTSKFITGDRLVEMAERAGDGLALMQDIVGEHAQLFPDRPLKVRELRAAAVAARMSVEEYWLKQYNVPAAREARDRTQKESYEKKLREEGAAIARQEFADKYGNPDTRPLVESRNFLVPRKESGREAKQPWELGTDLENGSNDRVRRATQNALKAQVTTH